MADSGNNINLIQSRVMEVFMESFKRGFDGKDEYAHEIPNLLKNICQVYCVHNKKKVVTYKKLPESTIFVDDVDDFLEFFNPIVKRETHGYFQELDELTVELMRDPSFRCSLIGFSFCKDCGMPENVARDLFTTVMERL
ncbi:hypothetical protein AVEN_224791-1 [Araneus ventricosus]|uniref:Uncharacterized protein n=1 Tax=Araneus ventricosus TaxID=182803 RepID=A0A4Y2X385_ARAVE|nr:hypothetical protein AVEN_224791-1 [Araneus ventricosus]